MDAVCVAIDRVTKLLDNYLPLPNAHANDFLTLDMWSSMLPAGIASELDSLARDRDLVELFQSHRARLQANDSDWLAACQSLDEMAVPEPPIDIFLNGRFNKLAAPVWRHSSLDSLARDCAACSLDCLRVANQRIDDLFNQSATVLDSAASNSDNDKDGNSAVFVSHGMGIKKSHEVEQMSRICDKLATKHGVDLLVDVGSGKGYLGAYLYLAHRRRVLEIDAKPGNTAGAIERRANLEDKWRFLVRRAEGDASRLKREDYLQHLADERATGDNATSPQQDSFCASISAEVRDASHLAEIVAEKCGSQSGPFGLIGLHTCGQLACTLLQFYDQSPGCGLMVNVGCCYNLLTEAYCISPCEELQRQQQQQQQPPPTPGFPLSARLLSRRFAIGRNARILASQSPERLADSEDQRQMHRSMFYRVLLQQLLLDRLGRTDDNWVVGKIGKRCPDFLAYARLGMKRLGLAALSNEIDDASIVEYERRFAHVERRLFRFFLLRCLLAPAVEACILLDRLLWLMERSRISLEAGGQLPRLCRIFQPKMSPRCYALVATKL